MPEATANIGVVGLAVMGSNLARNFASREGNTVAVFNRADAKTETLIDEHPEAGFVAELLRRASSRHPSRSRARRSSWSRPARPRMP